MAFANDEGALDGYGAALYTVVLARPDGRWWQATVIADNGRDAIVAARRAGGLRPDAPVLLCDRSGEAVPALALAGDIITPRGWGAS